MISPSMIIPTVTAKQSFTLIDRKLAGKKIVYEEPHPEEAKDLMLALQETIATLNKK